jgi:hypothetical protein
VPTTKLRITSGAAAKLPSPPWLAFTVTAPLLPLSVTVEPATVAGPARIVYVTGNPLLAVAFNANAASVGSFGASGSNVIVCAVCPNAPAAHKTNDSRRAQAEGLRVM